jgi:mono/diheme cytochrome c family protein
MSKPVNKLAWFIAATAIVGCASAATSGGGDNTLRTTAPSPLGAHLTTGAKTGATVPLRFDPNAKVVIATQPNLPAASFAPTQAARGEKVFDQTCASCHQGDQFIGKTFVDNWSDRRVGDLYTLIRSSMPVDNPGGLKDQEYLDVVAYLLKANHASPNADSLSADTTALKGHKIGVHP